MTVKEYLRQAYRLNNRINNYIAEAGELRAMALSISSPGFEEHFNPNRPNEASYTHALEKLWNLQERINAEIDRLVDLKEQIMSVINAVTNADERMVLYCRYIRNMTWENIGDELMADRTTVYRWHNAALRHVVLPENPIRI